MIVRVIICVLVLGFYAACSTGSKNGINVDNPTQYNPRTTFEINLDVKKYILPNGLKLLVYEDSRLPIFSYYTFFDVGSRFEEPGLFGASHFLEHMMFKGAQKYGPGHFDKILEGRGGRNNAYTSYDRTVYYENMPSDSLELIADLEVDRMVHLLLEEDSFEKERKVILDERLRSYDTNPATQLFIKMMEEIFYKMPYGRAIIGTVDDIKGITRENMQQYFRKYYAPNNAVIVVAGAVKADEVFKIITEKYAQIPPSPDLEMGKQKINDDTLFKFQGALGRDIKLQGVNPYPMFTVAYRGARFGERQGFILDVLASVLGDGQSSYLNQKFVFGSKPLFASISAGNYTLKKSGVFYLTGQLLANKKIEDSKNQLLRELYTVCNDDRAITERSVQKAKNQYLVSYFGQLQSLNGIAEFVGLRENLMGDYAYYYKELEIYNSITTVEVKAICKELFVPNRHVYISVWNKNPHR